MSKGCSDDFLGSRESNEIDVRLQCLKLAGGDIVRARDMADFVLGLPQRIVVDGNTLTIRSTGIACGGGSGVFTTPKRA